MTRYAKEVGAFLKYAVRNGSRVAAHVLHDMKTQSLLGGPWEIEMSGL